jgi:Protein of unknown function (DUF3309)
LKKLASSSYFSLPTNVLHFDCGYCRPESEQSVHQGISLFPHCKADGTFVPLSVYSARRLIAEHRRSNMSIGTIILIILVIALLGGFSGIGGGPFYGTGYYGGGGLGLVVVVLIILLLMGRL